MLTFWMTKTLSGSVHIWKVIINLLNISFAEGVTMPAIRSIADEVYIFQQDNALAHRARQTV